MTRRREELVSAPNLDYPTFTKVQYQVFHELVKAQGADLSYITEEFYRWKYTPPAGSGKTSSAWSAAGPANQKAIAAMAFGTETVPAVNKIVGPGNAFVNEAKRQVFGPVGIDQNFRLLI